MKNTSLRQGIIGIFPFPPHYGIGDNILSTHFSASFSMQSSIFSPLIAKNVPDKKSKFISQRTAKNTKSASS